MNSADPTTTVPKAAAQNEGQVFPGPAGDPGQPSPAERGAPPPDIFQSQVDPASMGLARKREAIIDRFSALLRAGCSVTAAAEQVKVPATTIYRWRKRYELEGLAGLRDHTDRCGKASPWTEFLTEDILLRVRDLYTRTGSKQLSWQLVAEMPDCPQSLAGYLAHTKRIPLTLLRAAHVNPEIILRSRGPKHYQLGSIVNHRTMTEIMTDGSERQVEPGDWWEFDDMSSNQPFWFEVPEGFSQEKLAKRFGCAIGRQGLFGVDAASGFWLGHMLVGRPRDAYRAEDLLRFFRNIISVYGKPRRGFRLERGIWRSRAIKGYDLGPDDDLVEVEIERPAMDEAETHRLQDGLRAVGIEIQYTYCAHTKAFIEGGFNRLQALMSATAHTDIGRVRGEYELAAKALVSVHAGSAHPANKGFGYIDAVSESFSWAEDWVSTHAKHGRLHRGVPKELWDTALAAKPLAQLARDEMAVFLPRMSTIQIRGAHLNPVEDGQVYQFIHPELFAALGNGYRLAIRWDPADPSLGGALYNLETSSANTRGWREGQFVGWAEYDPPAPQFGRSEDDTSKNLRKRYLNYHRTVFAALKHARESAARDGRGNAVVRTGQAPVAPVPPAPTKDDRPVDSPAMDAGFAEFAQRSARRRQTMPIVTRSSVDDFVGLESRLSTRRDQVDQVDQVNLEDLAESDPTPRIAKPLDPESVQTLLEEL